MGGTQFFPLIIREHFVWGYTVFSLYIRDAAAVFQITQAQFFPLIIREKNCMGYTVFPLNIRDELPNSVDLFEPVLGSWTQLFLVCHKTVRVPHQG